MSGGEEVYLTQREDNVHGSLRQGSVRLFEAVNESWCGENGRDKTAEASRGPVR